VLKCVGEKHGILSEEALKRVGGKHGINRKWLRIYLAWCNSNKRVSWSFKQRGSRSLGVMHYCCYVKRVRPDCVRTPSVWACTQKPRWHYRRQLLMPSACQTFRPKRALTSISMEVNFKRRLLGLSLLVLADFVYM